jgi:hypothetical protein
LLGRKALPILSFLFSAEFFSGSQPLKNTPVFMSQAMQPNFFESKRPATDIPTVHLKK